MFSVGDYVVHRNHGFGVVREVLKDKGIYLIQFYDMDVRSIGFSEEMERRENEDYVIVEKEVFDTIHVYFKVKDKDNYDTREKFSVSRFNELMELNGKIWDDGIRYFLISFTGNVTPCSYSNYSSKLRTVEFRDVCISARFTFCDEYWLKSSGFTFKEFKILSLTKNESEDFAAFVYEKYQERIKIRVEF